MKEDKISFIYFFRTMIGIIILIHFISILQDFDLLFGMNSLIPSDLHTIYLKKEILFYPEIIDLFNNFTSNDLHSKYIFIGFYIILCVFIIIGFYSRLSAFLLLIIQIALIKSSYYYSYGVDFFTSMSLIYIILLPSDDYFSVINCFKKRKIFKGYEFTQKTFQLHLSIAYFVSGLEKLSGYNWRNGESIWKAIHLPNFTNDFFLNFNTLGEYKIIFIIIGWLTILIELLYPIFIWQQKTRLLWLFFTISLHVGIAITLNLYFFSAIMITWNLTAFYFNHSKEENQCNIFNNFKSNK